jgi:hypothetical protein
MHITLPMLLHHQVVTRPIATTTIISTTTPPPYHLLFHSQVDIADVIDAGRILLVGGHSARLDMCVLLLLQQPRLTPRFSSRIVRLIIDFLCMSPLEHSAQLIQHRLADASSNIASDQNQLIAAVCSARTHVQTAAKKLQDAQSAHAKVASSAAAAPNNNIHACLSAARAQRDDLLALALQLQELAEFMTVIFACLCASEVLFPPFNLRQLQHSIFLGTISFSRFSLTSHFRQLRPTSHVAPKCLLSPLLQLQLYPD